jgi:TonB-linked SusC/RagA family outer membrane protein
MKINIGSISMREIRIGLLSCIFLSLYYVSYSQQAVLKISGKVMLGAGAPDLSGTSVQVKGGGKGVTSDASGYFELSVQTGETLVISHVGYKPVEMKVNARTGPVNMTLDATDNSLDQVVVVSYGKQRQRDITGSVVKVNANELQDVPATEFGTKLQGKVPGLQVSQATGIPGRGMTFRIRGAASLSSGNQPLIVIDGQPIISDIGTGDINLINPDEIESYTVLKDASATALYGSRASNGVIIITTRQAKTGRLSISANAYYGLQNVPQRGRPDLMNAREFATFMNGFYQDKITYERWINPLTGTPTVPADYANPDQYGKGTDWYNSIFRTAPMENYSLFLSSGSEKASTSATFTYFNQQGVLYNTGVQRYSFRSNSEFRPSDKIKIGLNIAPSYQVDHNTPGSLDGSRQIISGADISSPLVSPYNADGSYANTASSYGMYALPNFLKQEMIMMVNQNNFHLLSNAFVDIEVIKGLHAKTTINADYLTQDYNAYYGTQYGIFGSPPPRPPSSSQAVNSSNNAISWLNENTLDYLIKLDRHTLDVLGGYSAQKFSQNTRSLVGTGFSNDDVPWINGASSITSGNTNKQVWTIASAFARLNYDYDKRYFVTGTIRRDGSSRFGDNKKYGVFPSVSAGWIVSDEAFFPKSNQVSFLKVKGSYGLTGNNSIGGVGNNYAQAALLSPTNYVFNGTTSLGESITSLGNKDLTWETSKQTDVGLEMNLLNNRIVVSYDYYNKLTDGMLSTLQIPYASGFSSITYNVGQIRMWGHELQISSRNLTGPFSWTTDLNISLNNNKVLQLVNNTPIGGVNKYNDFNRTAVGHPIGELYGYIFEGVYMNQADFDKYPHEATSAVGTARMKDVNGDGIIDINDRTFIGHTSPKYIFGITNSFQYKHFDLNIIAAGQAGNMLMNTNYQNLQNLDGIFNIDKDMANRWRSEADPGNGRVPRTLANTTELYRTTNTNWVYRGDYLTIKNVALGYTFPQNTLRYIKSIRVYVSAQQLFVFTRYPGQNPEVNDSKDNQTIAGLDDGSYPIPRTFMLGANINF